MGKKPSRDPSQTGALGNIAGRQKEVNDLFRLEDALDRIANRHLSRRGAAVPGERESFTEPFFQIELGMERIESLQCLRKSATPNLKVVNDG